jgi:nucleoside-diphosphate-sugar epimerase
MKRALVTGGAGFIGSNIVKSLVSAGWQVDVVDDMSNGHLELLAPLKTRVFLPGLAEVFEAQYGRDSGTVFVHECDFSHEVILSRICRKEYDVVFHQAAVPRVSYSVEHPVFTTDVNLMRSIKLLQSCVNNVKRVVIASSSSVYGGADLMPTTEDQPRNPKSPYALQKSCLEDYSRMFGLLYELDTVNLRYFNVFGPGQYGDSPYSTAVSAWCTSLKSQKPLRSDGDGSQTRDLCYVDNVVSANILAAISDKQFMGKAYNICCGDRTSNKEILDAICQRFPDAQVENAPWRAGDVMHTQGSWKLANEDFGYKPLVTFWDGLEKTLEWWGLTKSA